MYKIISHHKDIDRVLKDFKELLFSELLEDSDKERLKITFNSLWACGQEEVNLFKGLKEVRNRKDEKILVVLNKIDVFPNIDEENRSIECL